jgi:hypothetical protein
MKFSDKQQYLRFLVDKRGMQPVYLIMGLTYDCNSDVFHWEQLRKNKERELLVEALEARSPAAFTGQEYPGAMGERLTWSQFLFAFSA